MTGTAGTRAFLFADLRGYTRYVDAYGDAAAAELLTDYRAMTRGVISRHEGAEIRTEGDGIYVVFRSVAAAVDAGLELVDAAAAATAADPSRPIRVAVGIHAGETTATEEGPVGSAVNIAARICAKAEAGEVLVSGTVRDLVRTARPYRATSLGAQHLKGVGDPVPVFRLESAPSGIRARFVRKARARRRRLALLGAAMAVALVAVGAVWAVNRPPDCLSLPASTKDVVVRIDPVRGCVVQVVAVGRRPGPLVAVGGAIWVASREDLVLQRIDDGIVRATLGLPGSIVDLAASPDGDVWVLDIDDRTLGDIGVSASVARIDGDVGRLRHSRLLPEVTSDAVSAPWAGLAYLGDGAWVTHRLAGQVARVRIVGPPDTSVLTLTTPLPAGIGPIEAAAGAVWVGATGGPTIFRIVGSDTPWQAFPLDGHGGSVAFTVDRDVLWISRIDGWLTRFDPATHRSDSFDPDGSPAALAVNDGTVWFVDGVRPSVGRFDGDPGRVFRVATGGTPADVAIAADGSVWVTISGP